MPGDVFIESTPPPLPGSGDPVPPPSGGREAALRKVRGPGIALAAVGVLNLGMALLAIVLNVFTRSDEGELSEMVRNVEDELRKAGVDKQVRDMVVHALEWSSSGGPVLSIALPLLNMLVGAFIAYAGVRMMTLRGRTPALFAAVISMLPCLTPCLGCCPCCVIGIPVGVWVIMTLQRADVFDQFR